MEFPDIWPYITWKIKNISNLSTSCSGDIYVKGYRMHLLLEKKYYVNAKDDSLEMRLVDTEMELKDPLSFLASVYLKDPRGENHFVQESRIVCRDSQPIKLIWRVTLFDLIENSSLSWKSSLDFVCMFGPESKHQKAAGEDSCHLSSICSCKVHLEKLSLDLSRMLVHTSDGDVILRCGERKILAHKNILSVRSITFKKMFENHQSEEFPSEISISDVDYTTLRNLVVFLYRGKVMMYNQTVDSAMQLYEVAVEYKVNGLKEECMKFLVENLEEGSACTFLLFASEKKDEVFVNHVISYIIKNEILKSEGWVEFSNEHPELAIQTYFSYLENYLFRRSYLA